MDESVPFFLNGNKNRAVSFGPATYEPMLACVGQICAITTHPIVPVPGFFRVKTYLISWGYNIHPQKLTPIPKMAIFETFYTPSFWLNF